MIFIQEVGEGSWGSCLHRAPDLPSRKDALRASIAAHLMGVFQFPIQSGWLVHRVPITWCHVAKAGFPLNPNLYQIGDII